MQICKCCKTDSIEDEQHILFACPGIGSTDWLVDFVKAWTDAANQIGWKDSPPPHKQWLHDFRWPLRAALIPTSLREIVANEWMYQKFSKQLHLTITEQTANLFRRREALIAAAKKASKNRTDSTEQRKNSHVFGNTSSQIQMKLTQHKHDSILKKWTKPCLPAYGLTTLEILELYETKAGRRFAEEPGKPTPTMEARKNSLMASLRHRFSSTNNGRESKSKAKRWPVLSTTPLDGSTWIQAQLAREAQDGGGHLNVIQQQKAARDTLQTWIENNKELKASTIETPTEGILLLWELEHRRTFPTHSTDLRSRTFAFAKELEHIISNSPTTIGSWLRCTVLKRKPKSLSWTMSVRETVGDPYLSAWREVKVGIDVMLTGRYTNLCGNQRQTALLPQPHSTSGTPRAASVSRPTKRRKC